MPVLSRMQAQLFAASQLTQMSVLPQHIFQTSGTACAILLETAGIWVECHSRLLLSVFSQQAG